jgi:hypothetical protein
MRLKLRRLLILSLLLWAPSAYAQYVRYDGVVQSSKGVIPGALVAICSQPATTSTTPCSPLATIYSNTTGAGGPAANPTTSDLNGNYHFYIAPGVYTLQIYGAQIVTPYVLTDQSIGISTAASATNLVGPGTVTGNYTHSGTETFTGLLNCKNFENVQCVDGVNSQGWAGGDIGAWVNSAVAALPAAGGTVYITAPSAITLTTTITDSTKTVLFQLGATNITSNVQMFHLVNNGSSIVGVGDNSNLIAGASLPALTPLVFIDGNTSNGNYRHTVKGLHLTNGRNSNTGLLQLLHCVKSLVEDIYTDGSSFYSIGVETWDGFSETFKSIRCLNAAASICVGVTAPHTNVSNETFQDIITFNETVVAINYATTNTPSLTDSTTIINPEAAALGGLTPKMGVTTVNGAQSSGITSFPVTTGTACFAGYQAWIGIPFDDEWNVVTAVNSNTLTLAFPTRQSHANGERVLCGLTGMHIGQNSTGTTVTTAHIEEEIPAIDCQDCQELTLDHPNLASGVSPNTITATFTNGSAVIAAANTFYASQPVQLFTTGTLPTNFSTGTTYYVSSTGLSGTQFELSTTVGGGVISAGSAGSGTQSVSQVPQDGIRFDSVLQATLISPHINGFLNAIELTNRSAPWGLAFGVNVMGYTKPVPGNINESIVNNTGGNANFLENGCTGQYPGSITCPFSPGQFGAIPMFESGVPTGVATAGYDVCYGDSTAHAVKCSYNNGSYLNVPQVIASGTAAMTTAAITAGNCGTTVTVSASGVATTDTITWAFAAAPAGSNAGIVAWPTANNVNFAYCPGVTETPTAATINWRVLR